jgi:hypothetical protein
MPLRTRVLQVAYLTLKSWLDERQEKKDREAPVSR